MAKFSFYEIKIMKFPQTDNSGNEIPNVDPIVIDKVRIQIAKKVSNQTMHGEKGEEYDVPVADIPYLFGHPEVKFPAINGFNCESRIDAVREFLDNYLGSNCYAEQVRDGKKQKLTLLEFE